MHDLRNIRPKNFINYFLPFHPSRKPNMKKETRIVVRNVEAKKERKCRSKKKEKKRKKKENVVRIAEACHYKID